MNRYGTTIAQGVNHKILTNSLFPFRCSLRTQQQISGLGLLISGIVVLNDVTDFNHFLDGRITALPIVLIVTGLLIFVIAFLGCYGALKESPKLLYSVSVDDT